MKWLNKYQRGGKVKQKKESTLGSDTYTRMMNMITTFGGSAIGDAVDGISPEAADWLEKYSGGMIPHTTEEMMAANRGSYDRKLEQAGDAADSVTLGVVTGGLAKLAGPYISKTLQKVKAAKASKEFKKLPFNHPNTKPTSGPLSKEMEPYIGRYEKPKSREEEIFESFLSPKRQDERITNRTVHLDREGNNITKQGFDGNLVTRPLTPFTRNELTKGEHLYRKIGNKKGLQDLINKGGAQAPKSMRMNSGFDLDAPFFGIGKRPNENYRGIFAVESSLPSKSRYNWSERAGGTNNYGVAPFDPKTGNTVKNIPLEDLEVYRKKWFSNNYRKLDKNNLEVGMRNADLQVGSEKAFKWGARGEAADQIFNDGEYTDKAINAVKNRYQKGGVIEDDRGQWAHPGEVRDFGRDSIKALAYGRGSWKKAQKGVTVKYGTPEYEKAYNEGRFKDVPNQLDEITITADKKTGKNILKKYPFYDDLYR